MAKTDTKAEKAKPGRKPKPKPEYTTNAKEADEPKFTADSFLAADRDCRRLKTVMEEAVANYRGARKRIKGLGVNMKAYARFEAYREMDEETRELEVRDTARYCAWGNVAVGTQGSLFGASDDQAPRETTKQEMQDFEAETFGYKSGLSALPNDNPKTAGTSEHQAWDKGWRRGKAALDKRLDISGVKPATKAKREPERKGGAAPPAA